MVKSNQIPMRFLSLLKQFSEFLFNNSDFEHFLLSFDLFEYFLILFPSSSESVILVGNFNQLENF